MKERSARACQPCRRRKVKCNGDGDHDCPQCQRLALRCSYPEIDPTSRLRRATIRGSIIQTCLPSERHAAAPTTSVCESHLSPSSPPRLPTVDTKYFLDIVPNYTSYVLPTFPVISEADLVSAIDRMNDNSDEYALLHSAAAATWTVMRDGLAAPVLYLDRIQSLYGAALNARGYGALPPRITVETIMTSVFLSKSFTDADHDSRLGYYYLRDAITRLQLLRVDNPNIQAQQTPWEARRRERAYWLLFIQERFDVLSSFRPPVLSPLPTLPEYDESFPFEIHAGFLRLIELFQMVDTTFVQHRLDGSSSSVTLDWIRQKQAELGGNLAAWEEDISCLSLVLQVDLGVTRHWLRALVWQMSLHVFSVFGPGRAEEDYMSILFPVSLSRKLRSLLANMPRQVVEIHSTGIVYKIFEIAAISADVLEHVIARMHDPARCSSHLDDFVFLSRFCSSMPKFNERNELEARFEKVRSLFPWYFEREDNEVAVVW